MPSLIELNVIMMQVVMLNAVMLIVIMLGYVMLIVVILSAVMLNAVMLIVVEPTTERCPSFVGSGLTLKYYTCLKSFKETNALAYLSAETQAKIL
jgi:hypothetical protein